MAKKRSFYCNECHSAIEIYKKSKKHRLLVCPNCGIIASNPLPLAALALSALPSVIEGVTSKASKKTKEAPSNIQKMVTDSLDKPNKGERYVKMALGG